MKRLIIILTLLCTITAFSQKVVMYDTLIIKLPTKSVVFKPFESILDEVVVTGLTRATILRENPVAIMGVSTKTIDKTIEPNIIDALVKNVPGLTALKTGPNISKPFIRGLGYNRVLTLFDGIRQEGQQWGDEHGLEVDAYQISKAEVIKGPASLMYGSDAIAGVVSLFPYLPKLGEGRVEGRFVSEYQNNNGLLGNGFRIGQRKNNWLWQISSSLRVAENYRNAIDGLVYNTSFREFNSGINLGYYSKKGQSLISGTIYHNLQAIPDGSRDSTSRKFTKQVFEGNFDDIKQRPIVKDEELNGYGMSPLIQQIDHYRIYNNNRYQFGKLLLNASLGVQQNLRKEFTHPTLPNQAGLSFKLNTLNYAASISWPCKERFDFSFGFNGMHQENINLDATDFPIPDFKLFDLGAFIYSKYAYQKLTISAGIRWDTRTLSGNDFYVGKNPANGFEKQYHFPDTIGAKLQCPALDMHFGGMSLSVGFTYAFSANLSLKANIARGYRSPSITELASNGLDPGAHIVYLGNRDFIPEFSLQQDLGISYQNTSIQFTGSVFNNQLSNYIYLTQTVDQQGNSIVDAQGNKTFQYQQSAARLYGLETDIYIHPASWHQFSISSMLTLTYGINQKQAYMNKGNNGENLPFIPPLKWNGAIAKTFNTNNVWIPNIQLQAEWEYAAAQNKYLALFDTETATPAYTVFHLSAGTKLVLSKNNSLSIQLQVNNLFDLAYQNNLSRLKYFEYYSASPNTRSGIYNMGRNVSLKCILAF